VWRWRISVGEKTPEQPPSGADKREASRYGVLRQGQVFDGEQKIYCAIHDLSTSGAKLQVGVKLPQEFELIIDGLQTGVAAELKWQNGEFAGVAFKKLLSAADVSAVEPRPRLRSKRRP
jgi:hypothetical protein